jgi:hypothetical protein
MLLQLFSKDVDLNFFMKNVGTPFLKKMLTIFNKVLQHFLIYHHYVEKFRNNNK